MWIITLTTGTDVPTLSTGNDTISGSQSTYGDNDVLSDSSTTDTDTLTLSTTSNITAKPTLVNIETIVVNAEKVGTLTFDATGITNAKTLTFNRADMLSGSVDGSGNVTVSNLKGGNIVAGTKVADVSVAYTSTGNSSAAATITGGTGTVTVTEVGKGGVTVTGAAGKAVSVTEQAVAVTGSKATVQTSGTVTVTNAVDQLTLKTAGETTATIGAIQTKANSGSLTIEGSHATTIKTTAAQLNAAVVNNNSTGAVTLSVSIAAALDLTDVGAVSSVLLDADYGNGTYTIKAKPDQLITTKTNQTGTVTINNAGTAGSGTAKFAVLSNDSSAAVTAANLTFTNYAAVALDATADKFTASGTLSFGDAAVTLSGANDVNLGTIADAGSFVSSNTGKTTLSSNGNTANEQSIVLGAADDTVTVTSSSDTYVVVLGNGANTLTVTDAKAGSQFVGGTGVDTVTVTNVHGGATFNLGAGNDVVSLGALSDATDLVIAGGDGSDSLTVTATKDLTLTNASFSGFEVLNVAPSQTLTLNTTQFNALGSFALEGSGILAVTNTSTTEGKAINASVVNVAVGTAATLTLTGSAAADTITGSAAADTILTGNGADLVVGGRGADSITGGTGVDTIKYAATTTLDLALEAGTTAGGASDSGTGVGDRITTWTSGTDKIQFAASLLTNAIGTETDSLLSIAKTGTVTNVARFVHITDTAVGDNVNTHAGAVTVLNALTTTAVAIGDSFIAAMDNDTNTYLYYVKQVSAANTIATQDVTLIGVINGITTIANGDFVTY